MARSFALGALALCASLFGSAALAQSDTVAPAPAKPAAKKAAAKKDKKGKAKAAAAEAKTAPAPAANGPQAGASAPAFDPTADQSAAAKSTATPAAAAPASPPAPQATPPPAAGAALPAGAAPPAATPPSSSPIDPEEFRRQVMEEVRKEMQKARDELRQETAWVEQDSTARVHDAEALEKLRSRVNLLQPHGYFRTRYEFFYGMDLGRGTDPKGYFLFPRPFINGGGSRSQSDANMRFRFEPGLAVSEDLRLHAQLDALDNVLYGSNPVTDPLLDPYTPVSVLATTQAASTIKVKRAWAEINTPLGELLLGRMGSHWGLGILHNDGNGLDADYGDTVDRVAFSPREFRGFKITGMLDLIAKGVGSTGDRGELGRTVDLDTLDDGYRMALQVERIDSPDEARRKIDAGEWVIDYGLLVDYRVQGWDTLPSSPSLSTGTGGLASSDQANDRSSVVQRKAKIYQPDAWVSLRKGKLRIDAELASTLGSVGTRANTDAATLDPTRAQSITFFQWGGVLQASLALLPADAMLLGLEWGAASGDSGVYGFGARPWRDGSGGAMGTVNGVPFHATGKGDIDGPHFDFSNPFKTHGRINNFIFNRAFQVDTILFRNLVSAITSGWYLKPSIRYRPTGRKTGGADDTGFELFASLVYSQAWYEENTPGLALPLGLEANLGISYDTSDKFHLGVQYAILLPFSGMGNTGQGAYATPQAAADAGLAHAIRAIAAVPF